ncbi:MAG: hypothetical protein UR66_C0003G0075 [Candidatus Moranbacteria bacterium GW2011_GWE1_35_17]|nr:MAG: hypothetical protein UR66_C0003G0075 [Candidatus Moranbacteria bacterium GW2011_GWE1_35_17]KKP82509.1 MAG: hypothetical protein UR82_C0037G0006 [Candidatus Moranbacteria bacterium GW2011_GWF1_35_5]
MNYSLANVEKFLGDYKIVGDLAEGILARAGACAVRGIISDSSTLEIMGDDFAAQEFHKTVFFDIDHTSIIAAAMTKNNEEDRQTASDLKEAFKLIQNANVLLKKVWDSDTDNHLASGCYKALNAVISALSSKVNVHEQDEEYVFTRLMEAISRFADFYGVSMKEALLDSRQFTSDQIEAMFLDE